MERRKFTREFKLEAVRLIRDRGVSYAQASEDLKVHPTQLRNWVKAFADDPQHAFPGPGQMKPEQLEIAQLKREVSVNSTSNGTTAFSAATSRAVFSGLSSISSVLRQSSFVIRRPPMIGNMDQRGHSRSGKQGCF
jgi:transposase